ncbi:hypothetical protein DPMN_184014 [Dreissena polymorpha]|uniref:Uncharacterized protein n=1 Tax=Dreissena polymorpha TaxID=45954 RepID=A0A9D4I453_DREPO|nr:hypothetical protein DPMN_184014 [Dreissena polymorpha]
MALDTGMSKGAVYYIIRNVLKAKLRKKCKVHQLNMEQIQKRRAMSWELYLKLTCGKWRDFDTPDEAMFYLGGSYGKRRVRYVRMGENIGDALKFVKRDAFARGFITWTAVSSRGKSEIRIIPRAKGKLRVLCQLSSDTIYTKGCPETLS